MHLVLVGSVLAEDMPGDRSMGSGKRGIDLIGARKRVMRSQKVTLSPELGTVRLPSRDTADRF